MRIPFSAAFPFVIAVALGVSSAAQVSGKTAAANPNAAAEHAAALAESGHCTEALPLLKKSLAHLSNKDLQKRAGFDGVRCASALQQDDELLDFLRILNRQFPHDPEVLYVSVHAYSDLSSHTALELARIAPQSIPALKLDAEAREMQGKWDEAENDYRKILAENPNYPGIHFLLARIQLSKPNPSPDFKDVAKRELQQELEIDPNNAGAEYVLGELSRQAGDLDSAIQHFGTATKLDATFADAYLGLGTSLMTKKNYAAAIPPLEIAVKLQPQNPAGHYSLATAYARSGRKEDAEREFALHQQTAERAGGQGAQNPQ
jgi:tetratricopeptide (TPR) repeat protein